MGIDDMIWGRLTDQMVIEDGGVVSMANYVHPRVEPEIAFLLDRPLAGTVTGSEGLERVEPRLQNNLFDAVHLLLSVAETAVSRLSSWASRRIR